jgi:hypothetical protein
MLNFSIKMIQLGQAPDLVSAAAMYNGVSWPVLSALLTWMPDKKGIQGMSMYVIVVCQLKILFRETAECLW